MFNSTKHNTKSFLCRKMSLFFKQLNYELFNILYQLILKFLTLNKYSTVKYALKIFTLLRILNRKPAKYFYDISFSEIKFLRNY
jgi:hypothetical protein